MRYGVCKKNDLFHHDEDEFNDEGTVTMASVTYEEGGRGLQKQCIF